MPVTIETLLELAPAVIEAGYPLLLRGAHGIGKSEIAYQLAKKMKEITGKEYPVIERRLSQMTEGDLLGLPFADDETTDFRPMEWFHRACVEPCVLFLDEIDRAISELRQGSFQLTDSRTLNGRTLHPETIVIAAINGGEHGQHYQVGEMDPAELSRYSVWDLEPSIEEWTSWASRDKNVDPGIVDFIRHNPAHLEHKKEFEPGKVYPSRRSWKRLSDTLVKADLLESASDNKAKIVHLAISFVGLEASISLGEHLANFKRHLTIEEFLKGTKAARELYTNFDFNEHIAFVEKLEQSKALERKLGKNQLKNLVEYMLELPSEIYVKMISVVNEAKANVESVFTYGLEEGETGPNIVSKTLVKMLQGEHQSAFLTSRKNHDAEMEKLVGPAPKDS